MNNYEERLKDYNEKLKENYDIVIELENSIIPLPENKEVARILCQPRDCQELRIAETYLDCTIAKKNIKWAVDNGVFKAKNEDSNETQNLIIDYSINSIKSENESRSLESFIEERFGVITPDVSAKIIYGLLTMPKEEKLIEYYKKVLEKQEPEMTDSQKGKFVIAATYSLIKILSIAPSIFNLKITEQDIKNYEIYSRTLINLCEEGIKDNIKDYWNNVLSKLDFEDTYSVYNRISNEHKKRLAEYEPKEIRNIILLKCLTSLTQSYLMNSLIDTALSNINIIAVRSSVSKERLIQLVCDEVFSRQPIVETWFEIETFKDSYDQPTYKYPSYIAKYLKEAMRESKLKQEETDEAKKIIKK